MIFPALGNPHKVGGGGRMTLQRQSGRYLFAMRKLLAAALIGILSLGVVSPALAKDNKHKESRDKVKTRFELEFRDWRGDFWGNEGLARMVTLGVMKGNGDGTLAADRPVSRLEAAIMMSRLLDLEAPELPLGELKIKAPWGELKIENSKREFELRIKTREGEFKFEDSKQVPDWGRAAILTGLEHGFVLFDGAKLSPLAALNRLEAAIMLVKANGLDAEARARAGAELSFSDANEIDERLRGYIAIAVENGYVTGYEDGSFRPARLVTRAEWATLLDRLDRKVSAPVSRNGRQVKGIVTDVATGATPKVTMTTPVFPQGVSYAVDDSAVFYEKGKAITLADVAAGDSVIINLSADRTILMLTVNNVPVHTVGTVTAYTAPTANTAGRVTILVDGVEKRYPVTADTVVTLGDRPASPAEIRAGDRVKVTTEGAEVSRILIKVDTVSVSGAFADVDYGPGGALPTLTITDRDDHETSYTVADHATITDKAGRSLTMADLAAGDQLTLQVERNLVTQIVRTRRASTDTDA